MVTLQSASLPSLPTTSNASEITKYIKQNIDLNHGQEYKSEKVKSRSGHSFDSYRSDDQWKFNMLRRMGQKQCGFFAKTDIPYKECGNVELFSRRLVLNSLQKLGYNFENKVNLHNTEPGLQDKGTENGDVEQGEKTVRKNSSRPRQNIESENGMSAIKECLRKAEMRIVSVKAGQPLNAYIRKEQEEKELRLKQEEEKNSNTLDMLLIDPLEPGGVEVAMTMGNGDKHAKKELSERIKERILIKNKIIFQTKRPTLCRKKSNFVKKLDCLISLLTSTQNLKLRDLKTKVPLSKESLKILRKRPLNDPLQPNRLSRKSIMVTNNVVPPAQHLETSKANRLLPPIIFENTSRLELASPVATTIPRKRNFHQRHKNSPVVPSINVTKMETWDDLMSTEANSSRTNSATLELLNDNFRGPSRTGVIRKYSMYKRRVASWKTASEVPPWQKIIQEQRDICDKDGQNTRGKHRNDTKSRKYDVILEELKTGFEDTKEFHTNKMKEELESRIEAYRIQFESLKLGHLKEQDLNKMRNDVNEWRHKINMSRARPPLWFELLQQERENCQLQDDDQTTKTLKHLAKYNDLKYSPCIHAKLCLLVYSLPLYELCALHMLDAVKFFVCHILELPEGSHNEWLEERKLLKIESKST